MTALWDGIRAHTASPECRALHAHIFTCGTCYPRSGKYCPEGKALWIASEVPLRAAAIVAERSLHRRRYLLGLVPEWAQDALRAEVKRQWDEKRGEAIRDR